MKAAFLAIFLSSATAFGGGYISNNGGHLVRCAPGSTAASRYGERTILDLYEGRRLYGFTYERLRSLRGLPLERAFPRAMRIFFDDAQGRLVRTLYLEWFRARDREFVLRDRLPLWEGSASWARLAPGCSLEQGLVQFLPRRVGAGSNFRLWAAADAWGPGPGALPSDLKVAFLVHEYFYRQLWLIRKNCALANIRALTAATLSDQALEGAVSPWSFLDRPECGGGGLP